jgi:hypothetical protein
MPAFSSPTFPSNHEFDIRTLVRLVPVSSFFLRFFLSSEPFTTYNCNGALSLSPYNKPRLRRSSLLITHMGSQQKNHVWARFGTVHIQ